MGACVCGLYEQSPLIQPVPVIFVQARLVVSDKDAGGVMHGVADHQVLQHAARATYPLAPRAGANAIRAERMNGAEAGSDVISLLADRLSRQRLHHESYAVAASLVRSVVGQSGHARKSASWSWAHWAKLRAG